MVDLRQVPEFFIKIQAVADEKSMRNSKTEIIDGDLVLTPFGLVDKRTDTDGGRSLFGKMLSQPLHGEARIDDVFHQQDMVSLYRMTGAGDQGDIP